MSLIRFKIARCIGTDGREYLSYNDPTIEDYKPYVMWGKDDNGVAVASTGELFERWLEDE
jgi:hypothetical protein